MSAPLAALIAAGVCGLVNPRPVPNVPDLWARVVGAIPE